MAYSVCGMHTGYFGLGWLFQLLVFVAFFAVVWWLLKGSKGSEGPEQILKRRLASGEISKKEYEALKKEIK